MPLPTVASLLPCLSRLSLRTPQIGSGRGKASAHAHAAAVVAPELAEKCVGFVAVSRFTRGAAGDPPVLYIEELFVDPAYRRQGIARCLLKRAISTEEDVDTATAALVVRLHAAQQEEARALYKSVGFDFTAEREVPVLTEPVRRRKLTGPRKLVVLTPMRQAEAKHDDQVETYVEAPIAAMRLALQDACERAYQGGLRSQSTDVQAQQATLFIAGYPNIIELATLHHRPPTGDGGNVKTLLTEANWGVYGAYVTEPVPEPS